MGISAQTIKLLAQTLKDKKKGKDVITFGVQSIQGYYEDVLACLEEVNYEVVRLGKDEIMTDPLTEFGGTIHQTTFFKMLGFSKVESLDLLPDEKPIYLVNLNCPVPDEMFSRYDLVYDGGTMEHCFNIKEVLSNVVRLLRVGGMIIHNSPVTGWIGHGFYQFSPTLFFDFYSENGFEEMEMKIQFGDRYFEYGEFLPADLLGERGLLLFAARKMKKVDEIRDPMQNIYKRIPLLHNGEEKKQGKGILPGKGLDGLPSGSLKKIKRFFLSDKVFKILIILKSLRLLPDIFYDLIRITGTYVTTKKHSKKI